MALPQKLKVEIREMPLSELHPADYNPRKISDRAFAGLSESLDKFGILAHIVWNKRTGNIVGGHQRYRKLLDAGVQSTEVVVVDLDDNDEVALNITLNNPHVRGDFTADVMEQLRECEQTTEDFAALGLNDLYGELKRRGYEKMEKKEKKQTDDIDGEQPTDDDEPAVKEASPKSYAVITCPECGSKWRMEDNAIVFDARNETEEGKNETLLENGII